jgi:tetratricopeptide (TPR) repeat protein
MGEDPELRLEAAEVQERLGEEETAQEMYARAVEAVVNQVPGRNTAQLLKRLASHGHLSRLVPALRFRVAGILEQTNPEAAVGVLISLVEGDHNYEDRALALYKAARLQQAMGQGEAAAASYKRLISEFPDSQWAAPAREELCRLSKRSS